MKKIIYSQFYQLIVDKAIFLILLLWMGIETINISDIVLNPANSGSGGGVLFWEWMEESVYWMVFSMIIAAMLITKDFGDKTINYEVLAGNSRRNIFFGRFFTALLIAEAGTVLDMWFVPVIWTIRNGWGSQLAFSGAGVRTMLTMLAVYRLVSETALFAMLVKRKGIAYFLPLIILLGEDILMMSLYFSSEQNSVLKRISKYFSVFSLGLLNEIASGNEQSIQQADGSYMKIFDAFPEHILILVFMSAGLGTLMLLGAYAVFRKKDLE